ncbi:hypothetical protein BJ912DRAFT_925245 [Pholiota molesta]|nr:hypothetical protein BJ912DRAFT_925245 [Pholiota molesta]
MTGPSYSFSVLATLLLHVWTVAGSLYPIKPVSSTIYEAGLPAEVKWMEDGKSPLLNLTGNLKIDLYAGRSTYLATIGKEINPLSLLQRTLHFITVEPHQTIYTADFNIIQSPFALQSCPVLLAFDVSAQPNQEEQRKSGMNWNWALGRRSNPRGHFAMDMDKMRFRLMFIVWPALVGLSMAL